MAGLAGGGACCWLVPLPQAVRSCLAGCGDGAQRFPCCTSQSPPEQQLRSPRWPHCWGGLGGRSSPSTPRWNPAPLWLAALALGRVLAPVLGWQMPARGQLKARAARPPAEPRSLPPQSPVPRRFEQHPSDRHRAAVVPSPSPRIARRAFSLRPLRLCCIGALGHARLSRGGPGSPVVQGLRRGLCESPGQLRARVRGESRSRAEPPPSLEVGDAPCASLRRARASLGASVVRRRKGGAVLAASGGGDRPCRGRGSH